MCPIANGRETRRRKEEKKGMKTYMTMLKVFCCFCAGESAPLIVKIGRKGDRKEGARRSRTTNNLSEIVASKRHGEDILVVVWLLLHALAYTHRSLGGHRAHALLYKYTRTQTPQEGAAQLQAGSIANNTSHKQQPLHTCCCRCSFIHPPNNKPRCL